MHSLKSVGPWLSTKYELELADFENRLRSAGYEQLDPFFLLKEGELYDERDGGVQKLTKERLEEIADIQNARVLSNDATPVIVGHTKRHLPEDQQPPIVGLVPRWQVLKFYKTGKWGLQGTPWAAPGCKEDFRKYPRRSAEFWTNPDFLDPVSLLGANTPRLDLGLHQLSQQRRSIQLQQHYRPRTPLILEMDTMPLAAPSDPTMAQASPDAMGDAAIFNSDRWKKVEDCCQRMEGVVQLLEPFLNELRQQQMPGGPMGGMGGGMGGPPGMGAPPGGGPPGAAAVPPPPSADVGDGGGGGGGDDDDDDDDNPVQAAAAVAGGTNTMMPTQYDRRTGQPIQMQQPQGGRTRTQSAQRRGTQDPRDAQIEQLQLTVAALQLARIEDTVNATLDDMEQTIVFDRAREFARLTKLSKQEFDAEVAYMRNTYKEKEAPLPPEVVPIHLQARQPNRQTAAAQGPMTLSQARDMMGTPGDPAVIQPSAPKSTYEKLVDIVRNRGKSGKPLMQAYEEVMGRAPGSENGTTSVR